MNWVQNRPAIYSIYGVMYVLYEGLKNWKNWYLILYTRHLQNSNIVIAMHSMFRNGLFSILCDETGIQDDYSRACSYINNIIFEFSVLKQNIMFIKPLSGLHREVMLNKQGCVRKRSHLLMPFSLFGQLVLVTWSTIEERSKAACCSGHLVLILK